MNPEFGYWVGIENLRVKAFHGVDADERILGHMFVVDLEVEIIPDSALWHDELRETLDYALLSRWIHEEMNIPTKLLETVAFRISKRIQAFPRMVKGFVLCIRKLNPPMPGQIGAAYFKLQWSNPAAI